MMLEIRYFEFIRYINFIKLRKIPMYIVMLCFVMLLVVQTCHRQPSQLLIFCANMLFPHYAKQRLQLAQNHICSFSCAWQMFSNTAFLAIALGQRLNEQYSS